MVMNFERILGIVLFLSGVFLLAAAVPNYVNSIFLQKLFLSQILFLAEVLIGVFLIIFGLYLMKIIQLLNLKHFF